MKFLKYYNTIVTLIVLHVASKLCQSTCTEDYFVRYKLKVKKQNNSQGKWSLITYTAFGFVTIRLLMELLTELLTFKWELASLKIIKYYSD